MTESSSAQPEPAEDPHVADPALPAATPLPAWLRPEAGDVTVAARLLDLLDRGWTPRAIHDTLVAEFGLRAASARAIREQMLAQRPAAAEAPWRLSDADPQVAALVMPVIVAVCEHTHGARTHIDAAAGAWVATLRAASPDLPLWGAYRLAAEYARRAAAGEPADDLDAALALAPWRDPALDASGPGARTLPHDSYDAVLERLAARASWQRYRAAVSRSAALERSYPLVLGICADALLVRPAATPAPARRRPAPPRATAQPAFRAELRRLSRRVERLASDSPRAARSPRRTASLGAPPDAATTAALAALAPTITRIATPGVDFPTNVQPLPTRPLVWPPLADGGPGSAAPDGAARMPFTDAFTDQPMPFAAELALVVSPVEGFRGLIEVQDALARVPGVDAARVEAFTHGDARMLLESREALDPAALASELARLLGRVARVAGGSAPNGELQIALG
ncbi:MAG: hypothetical protein EXR63_02140 [Dehalococcoidia bacterium]|nr:hypothetical protein [Dehalococcoidia bacterium]